MPRKTQAAAPVPSVALPTPQSMPIDDAPPSILDELAGVQDATIHVYAEPDKGQGGAAFVCRVQASDYVDLAELLEFIKAHPDGGPGHYSLRSRVAGQWRGSNRIRIAGTRAPVPAVAAVHAAPAAPPPNDQFVSFLQTMVITLLGKDRPAPSGPGFGEVIEAAKLLAPPPAARTPISELRELLSLRDLLKSADAERDEGGGRDWLTAAIETFGPPIAAAVTAPPAVPPHPIVPPPQAIAPPSSPPPPAAAPARPPQAAPVQASQVTQLVGLLMVGARADGDPDSWASVALDLLGDYAPLVVGRPDALDLIIASHPPAAPFREWFGLLLQTARDMLADDGGDGDLTGTETPADGAPHVDGPAAVIP